MRIERLNLIGFGRFAGREFEFSPGLNLVFGQNETGKTTLITFIELMLYGAKRDGVARRIYLPEYEQYHPWSAAPYEGAMTLALDGGRKMEIFRRFDREREECVVNDPDLGKDLSGRFKIDKRGEPLFAAELWGMPRSVFLNTVMVRQLSLSKGFDETGDLSAVLLKAVSTRESGRDSGAADVLAILEKALDGVGKTERGGRARELIDRLEALAEELEDARSHRETLQSHKNRLKQLDVDRERESARIEALRSTIALTEIAALRSRVERTRELVKKKTEHEEALKDYQQFADFPLELRDEVQRLEDRKTDCDRDLQQHKERLEQIEARIEELKTGIEPYKIYLAFPDDSKDQMFELRAQWKQALANLQSVKAELSSDIAKAEDKMNRYRELKVLFEAIGEDADQRMEQMAEEEEALNEELLEISSRAGKAIWSRGTFRVLSMGSAILSVGSAAGALVLAILDRMAVISAIFAWPILALLAVLSAGFSVAMHRKRARIDQEGGDASREYEEKMQRRKEIRSERRTMLSLAGAKDLQQLFMMRAELAGLEQTLADNTAMMQQRRLPGLQDEVQRVEARLMDLLRPAGLAEGGPPTNDDISRFLDGFNKCRELREQGRLQEQLRTEHLGQKNSLEREKADIIGRLEEIYKQSGVKSYPKFQEKAEGKHWFNLHKRELERHTETLEALLDGRSYETLVEELEEAEGRIDSGAEAGAKQAPDGLEELKREHAERQQKIAGIARERNQLIGTVRTMQEKQRDPGLVGSDIERAEEELVRIRARREALRLAMEAINRAAETIHADFAPALNKTIGELARELTAGRYGEVMVGDEFEISVRSPERPSIVPAAALSAGARDQLYFAARLALSDLISSDKNEKLPLLLDDSFVEYDFERAGNALGILAQVARSRQVILFSCHRREIELAKLAAGDGFRLIDLRQGEGG